VWEIRIVCTDIVGTAIRWNSYSMTVFHEGTIRPNFRSQVAMSLPPPHGDEAHLGIDRDETSLCY